MREWLKDWRKAKTWNQSQMAEYLNISQKLVSKLELGGGISVTTAQQISKLLGVPWTKFFEDEQKDTA